MFQRRLKPSLDECFGLLTGQSLPILMCLENCAFQVPILPYFRQDDVTLCNWSCTLSFATSAHNGFQLSRGR
jgi:hypothetical protein